MGGSQLSLKSQLADFFGFRGRGEKSDLLEEELQPWKVWAHFIIEAVPQKTCDRQWHSPLGHLHELQDSRPHGYLGC